MKEMHKKWQTSVKKTQTCEKKSVKKLQTSEIKTQKCKFKWQRVTN